MKSSFRTSWKGWLGTMSFKNSIREILYHAKTIELTHFHFYFPARLPPSSWNQPMKLTPRGPLFWVSILFLPNITFPSSNKHKMGRSFGMSPKRISNNLEGVLYSHKITKCSQCSSTLTKSTKNSYHFLLTHCLSRWYLMARWSSSEETPSWK
jgi:hypothetical protein